MAGKTAGAGAPGSAQDEFASGLEMFQQGAPPDDPGRAEEPGENFLGTYKTREAAERGLQEKDSTISRVQNKLDSVARENARLNELIDAFSMRTPAPQAAAASGTAATPATEADSDDALELPAELPDPVDQPNEFRAAMARLVVAVGQADKRAEARLVKRIMTAAGQRSTQAQQQEAAWNVFKEEYPDLANHPTTVAGALAAVGNSLGDNPRRTMQRMAEIARAELGLTGASPLDAGGERVTLGRAAVPRASGTVAPAATGTQPVSIPTLTDQLNAIRKKRGLLN